MDLYVLILGILACVFGILGITGEIVYMIIEAKEEKQLKEYEAILDMIIEESEEY